ncbi:MAG: hypothetical protein RLZZ299_2621 [Pseudomonadota bacterium]
MERDAARGKKKAAPAPARTAAVSARAGKAPDDAALAHLARRDGNEGVRDRLGGAGERRDMLLAHIEARLSAMKGVQGAKQRAMASERRWFNDAAQGKQGFGLPDPSRWAAPAARYRRAAELLCAGNLAQGTEVLREAAAAERAAREAVPVQVDVPEDYAVDAALPSAAEGPSDAGCPRRNAPGLFALADEVLRAAAGSGEVTARRVRAHRGWWDVDAAPDAEAAREARVRTGGAAQEDPARREADASRAPKVGTGAPSAIAQATAAASETGTERAAPERAPAEGVEAEVAPAAEAVRAVARRRAPRG